MNCPVGKMVKAKGQVGLYVYRGKGTVNGGPKLCYYFTHGSGRFVKVGWNYEGYKLEDAKIVRAEFVRELRHGTILPNKEGQITYSEAWERYEKYAEDIFSTSLRNDRGCWKANIKKALGNKPINTIRRTDIQRLLGKLEAKGLSRATRSAYLSAIRRVYRYLQYEGITKADPTVGLKAGHSDQGKKRYLEMYEIDALLEAVQSKGDRTAQETYAQVLLGVEMGFRRSEMYTLKGVLAPNRDYSLLWEEVNFSTGMIGANGKGRKRRYLKMTPRVRAALLDLGPKRRGKVFSGLHFQRFNRAVKDLGLNSDLNYKNNQRDRNNWVSMHTLRHTFATYAVLETKDLFLVAKLLGHSDVQTTQRYAHLLKGQQEDAMDQIGAFFSAISKEKNSEKSNVIFLDTRRNKN